MSGTVEARLLEKGIRLPNASTPPGNFVPYVITGNLVFISGQVAVDNGELKYPGIAGETISTDDAYRAARLCGLNVIAQLKIACDGDLDRVKRVVKLGGFVKCTPDFTDQPKVVNGASDLMVEVFGEAGRHARTAVGAPSLPRGSAVEVDGLFEISL